MRLSAKIFVFTIIVIVIALSSLGYLMINSSFENAVIREIDLSLDEFKYLKYSFQSKLSSDNREPELNREQLISAALQTADLSPEGDKIAIIDSRGDIYFSAFPEDYLFTGIFNNEKSDLAYTIQNDGNNYSIIISNYFIQNNTGLYFYLNKDITDIIIEKNSMLRTYVFAYCISVLGSCLLTGAFSRLLTNPIRQLMRSSRKISNGKYDDRVNISSTDEIGDLADSFNRMASMIEEKINELYLNAQQKEDFVGNFAHELKTPLTSVIGYADRIYQKDLSKEDLHNAAEYILNEGLRLEALAHKMMDLIVMNRTDFVLSYMHADEVINDSRDTLIPMMQNKEINFTCTADKGYIKVEYDLFKTLLLNLADNASKADSKNISLTGTNLGNTYRISITDDGRGIPEDQLSRITEAFYMIDKSRSRKQHGAGLGLALCQKIAEIHGTKLDFKSTLGQGTTVSVELEVYPEQEDLYE
ncbi:MAG: HAMP domain-containing histidine kinase [Christensenellaceae bacterium]|nr:HAMP domain-containing histidine kinase [Christensenellaceae bacterium]